MYACVYSFFVLFFSSLTTADNWERLHQPSQREHGLMSDVWDGSVLQRLSGPGQFFSTKTNLALSLNTDGVPLHKSSSWSLWPVFLTILNLPASIRMKAENVILAGLWYGPSKPPMTLLLEPVLKSLQYLSTSGVVVRTPTGLRTIRAMLVMGVFDLPAKAAVLCAKQFNGEHGCSVCVHPGERLRNGARIYLPHAYPDRTHESVSRAAEVAQVTGHAVDGIKGVSPLAGYVDVVLSVPTDYMHAVLEGVVALLMKCWFSSSHHREPQYIGRRTSEIDAQLMRQRPPSEFTRPPRSIEKHLSYWKASELRNWLLFYSLPLLLPHLPPLFWHHYALLVVAMHILLQSQLTDAEIEAAEQMLCDFYHLFPELYGNQRCTSNVHQLSHLTKYVRLWGPLWTHSSFGYENKNGTLKRFIHNRSDVVTQLLYNIDVSVTLQHLYPVLTTSETEDTVEFLSPLNHTTVRRNMMKLGEHMYVVGKLQSTVLGEEATALGLESGAAVQAFTRLFKDGVLYNSTKFRTEGKRDNTMCAYRGRGQVCYGQIILFVTSPELCAIVRECVCSGRSLMEMAGPPCREVLQVHRDVDLLHSYMKPISGYGRVRAVHLRNLCGKSVLLHGTSCDYITSQPNCFEQH